MKVSIVTVTWNSAATLSRTISSVLRQTYKDIEYIVVDGLSTDDTINIIKANEAAFKGRMRWISEKDDGIYDAMNKGIRMASGDIVGILNSDDFLTADDIIEKIVQGCTDDTDAIYGDVYFIKDSDSRKCVRYYSGRPFRPWMVRYGYIPPHPSFYVRKAIYDKYGLYDTSFRISADVEMIARLTFIHKIRTKYIPMVFVTMLVGGESTKSLKNRWLGTKEDLIACRKLGIKSNIVFVHFKYIIKSLGYLSVKLP